MENAKEADIGTVLNSARNKIADISKNPSKYISDTVLQVKLACDMLSCYMKKECSFPWRSVSALLAVLIYFINPFDIIPDFIPGIGYIDDLTALAIAFSLIKWDLKKYAKEKNLNLKEYGLE